MLCMAKFNGLSRKDLPLLAKFAKLLHSLLYGKIGFAGPGNLPFPQNSFCRRLLRWAIVVGTHLRTLPETCDGEPMVLPVSRLWLGFAGNRWWKSPCSRRESPRRSTSHNEFIDELTSTQGSTKRGKPRRAGHSEEVLAQTMG